MHRVEQICRHCWNGLSALFKLKTNSRRTLSFLNWIAREEREKGNTFPAGAFQSRFGFGLNGASCYCCTLFVYIREPPYCRIPSHIVLLPVRLGLL